MRALRIAAFGLLCLSLFLPVASARATEARRPSGPASRLEPADERERESPPQRRSQDELESLAETAQPPIVRTLFAAQGLGPAGLDWTFLGPRPMVGEYWSSGGDVGGRVAGIAPSPVDAATAYAASAQGGLWKTTDGGTTWNSLTEGLPTLSSGAVACDPFSVHRVYYGTGEQNYCGDCFYGAGLYRSTDDGANWTAVGTTAQVGSYIARILPVHGDTLYVACSRGLVRGVVAGGAWTTLLSTNWCDDVVADPASPARVVCTIYGSGIWTSTNSGATWTRTLVLPGRTNLGMAPGHPNIIFASAATAGGALYGAYRSGDGGLTWSLLAGTPDCLDGQGWYDNTVAVSPTDTATVLMGGVYPYNASYHGVLRTTTSGATWTDVSGGVDGMYVHPDQHQLAFGIDGTLWLANDGGVWTSPDLGDHWIDCNADLPVAQLYTVAAHPTDPNDIIAGTQDNGSLRYQGAAGWELVTSGDGGPVMYRHALPSTYFTTYVNMNPIYKWNGWSYAGTVTGPWASSGTDRADWSNGPLVEDPVTDGTMYAGTQRVWRTTNLGASWSAISGDLTAGSGVLRTIAISPPAPTALWTGASDGQLRRSRDGGTTWTVSPAASGSVPTIVASPTDTATAYLCVDVSTSTRVKKTTDGGGTWTSITGNLPGGVRGMSLAVDWRPTVPRLYLGTDYGVYASLDGGTNWVRTNGLPNVAVYALTIDLANSKLVAATHGRGAWRADLDVVGPTLALTAPAGGEAWPLTSTRTITWTASDPSGVTSVDLALSMDGGVTWPTTIATGLPNSGSYSWHVLPSAGTQARVRAIARDGLGQSSTTSSAANFSITLTADVPATGIALDRKSVV